MAIRLSVLATSLLSVVTLATAKGVRPGQIKNLVTFGDSYTDVGNPADGGSAWPVYAAAYGNFSLYPFAKSGATCSNNITYRPFPPVFEYQLPTYFSEVSNKSLKLNPEETAYTLWIGTNDVGVNSLLVGQGSPGVSVVDTTTCAVNWVKTLYDSGARNFLFQNMIPLELTILYRNESYYNRYWTQERNSTAWSVAMAEMTKSSNKLSELMLSNLAPQLPGAHVGLFNSTALFWDMWSNPGDYLNGTAPLNTTGCVHSCIFQLNESTSDQGDCTIATGSDKDSFLWYDELHPSEQADRIVARNIAAVLGAKSQNYTTWFS